MNIKFKMPKIGRNLSKKGIFKELFLTVVATTISIILTFGTAHIIERNQKKEAGRKTAMMVIHDIDNNIQQLHDIIEVEKSRSELSQMVISRLDDLKSISIDTLALVYEFISREHDFRFDDSKEKIFHSSPDSWKNINNPQFIDIAQQFYHGRSIIQNYFNNNDLFIEPVTREEQYELMLNSTNFFIQNELPSILNRLLKEKKVQLFLAYSPIRQNYYGTTALEWQRISDQLKFILGITDEELSQYIENQTRSGRRIKERELIGRWIDKGANPNHRETIEFRRNHSFTHIAHQSYPSSVYTGDLVLTETMLGTWELKGDTLIRNYESGTTIELDKSKISYSKENKDSVERLIAESEAQVKALEAKESAASSLGRRANTVFIDPSDSKIEMNGFYTDEQGKEKKASVYLVRDIKD